MIIALQPLQGNRMGLVDDRRSARNDGNRGAKALGFEVALARYRRVANEVEGEAAHDE